MVISLFFLKDPRAGEVVYALSSSLCGSFTLCQHRAMHDKNAHNKYFFVASESIMVTLRLLHNKHFRVTGRLNGSNTFRWRNF